jgi:hypothetical protein
MSRVKGIAGILATLLFLVPIVAYAHEQAQMCGQYNDPTITEKMTRQMLYPSGLVVVQYTPKKDSTQKLSRQHGTGAVVLSTHLKASTICKIEQLPKNDPLCNPESTGMVVQPRTYVVSNYHVIEMFAEEKDNQNNKGTTLFSEKEITKFLEEQIEESIRTNKKPIPLKDLSILFLHYSVDAQGNTTFDINIIPATVVRYNKKTDLSLLRLNYNGILPYVAHLAPKGFQAQPFSYVWTMGAPVGVGPMPTHGLFASRKEIQGKNTRFYLSSADVGPGSSGGPEFYDACYFEEKKAREKQAKGETYIKDPNQFKLFSVSRAMGVGPFGVLPFISLSIPTADLHKFFEDNHLGFLIPPAE